MKEMKNKLREVSIKILKLVLVGIILFFFLFPVYWLVTTAFKPSGDWFRWPPVIIPRLLTTENFLGLKGRLISGMATSIENILPYLINSTVIGVTTALLSTFISASTAYAISRFKVGGYRFASWILSIKMLPPIAVALPLYLIFMILRIIDTWWALILSYLVFTTPFAIWVLISFYNEIPKELDDAALVDGCSPFKAFLHVILPISVPGLAAVSTLSLIICWGELLFALVLTSSSSAQTLPLFVGRYILGWGIAWGPICGAGIIIMLPVVAFSLLMQKYLIRGLTFGAVKG